MSGWPLEFAAALVPVLLFLLALQQMDSFKLLRPSAVVGALAAGGAAALACVPLHAWILDSLQVPPETLIRYVAPITEETLKAVFVVWLILQRRVGFLVDAAVQGFAVGAGFALAENVLYLYELPDAPLLLWLIRGLGTAMLHGATSALLAIAAKYLTDKSPTRRALAFVPGWATAVVVHSLFNHVLLPPAAMAALLLVVLPPTVLLVFQRSERATRDVVGAGLDLDLEMMQLVLSDTFAATRQGRYLQQLKSRFSGAVVVDMFCLLRLELELSVQAKAMLMAREFGVEIRPDADLPASLDEIAHLERSIGQTGARVLRPVRAHSDLDAWLRRLLESGHVPDDAPESSKRGGRRRLTRATIG